VRANSDMALYPQHVVRDFRFRRRRDANRRMRAASADSLSGFRPDELER
jgi:hypothetical protein